MIDKKFFLKPTLTVARNLLGMKLSTMQRGKLTSGMIVEVEAYHGLTDLACHSYYGKTPRNEVMFREGGYCYVYFIYGMYFCVNVVTEQEGIGCAVLIRAIEPIDGIEHMQKRRVWKKGKIYSLCNGPGKLCLAMGIDKRLSGENFLESSKIKISPYKKISNKDVISSTRIGISKSQELPWRLYIKDNPWVSKY